MLVGLGAFAITSPANTDYDFAFFAACAVAWATGCLDDARKASGFPWLAKLAGQLIAASLVLASSAPMSMPPLVAALFLVVCMNAWNFLDNSDGVEAATALGVVVPCAFLLIDGDATSTALLAALVAGALLGVAPFNWPRARAYWGDAGSQTLGLALGWLALVHGADRGWQETLALHALPLLDMLQVVSVRLSLGIAPWRGDRRHLAHRLAAAAPPIVVAPAFLIVQGTLSTLLG